MEGYTMIPAIFENPFLRIHSEDIYLTVDGQKYLVLGEHDLGRYPMSRLQENYKRSFELEDEEGNVLFLRQKKRGGWEFQGVHCEPVRVQGYDKKVGA